MARQAAEVIVTDVAPGPQVVDAKHQRKEESSLVYQTKEDFLFIDQ